MRKSLICGQGYSLTLDKDKTETENELRGIVESQRKLIDNVDLNVKRLETDNVAQTERLDVQEIRERHLYLTIDGLPEFKKKSAIAAIIDRVNQDTDLKLENKGIATAYRVGKFKPNVHKKTPAKSR